MNGCEGGQKKRKSMHGRRLFFVVERQSQNKMWSVCFEPRFKLLKRKASFKYQSVDIVTNKNCFTQESASTSLNVNTVVKSFDSIIVS